MYTSYIYIFFFKTYQLFDKKASMLLQCRLKLQLRSSVFWGGGGDRGVEFQVEILEKLPF